MLNKGLNGPAESDEQRALVRVLRRSKVRFCAVPNGGHRGGREARDLVAQGVEAGVPDLLIFDRPPGNLDGWVGAAIEMKRSTETRPRDGERWASCVRPEQRVWLEALEARGWKVAVCYSAAEAVAFLRLLGFDLKG